MTGGRKVPHTVREAHELMGDPITDMLRLARQLDDVGMDKLAGRVYTAMYGLDCLVREARRLYDAEGAAAFKASEQASMNMLRAVLAGQEVAARAVARGEQVLPASPEVMAIIEGQGRCRLCENDPCSCDFDDKECSDCREPLRRCMCAPRIRELQPLGLEDVLGEAYHEHYLYPKDILNALYAHNPELLRAMLPALAKTLPADEE